MKKNVLMSCLLAGALLFASCGSDSDRRSRDRDNDDDGSRFERETETEAVETTETEPAEVTETLQTSAATDPTVSDVVRQEAYADYLSIIEENEDAILAYDWMATLSAQSGVMAPSENQQLALYDVDGDGLEELFLMKTETTYTADLEVYTFDPALGHSRQILTLEGFDVLAGGGGRYAVMPLDPGFLAVFASEGDERWTITYSVYEYNGSEMYLAGTICEVTYPNDDYTDTVYEYTMNDEEISETQYEEARLEVFDYVEALLQYNYLSDDDMISTLSMVESYSMSYDDMHDLLSGTN